MSVDGSAGAGIGNIICEVVPGTGTAWSRFRPHIRQKFASMGYGEAHDGHATTAGVIAEDVSDHDVPPIGVAGPVLDGVGEDGAGLTARGEAPGTTTGASAGGPSVPIAFMKVAWAPGGGVCSNFDESICLAKYALRRSTGVGERDRMWGSTGVDRNGLPLRRCPGDGDVDVGSRA